MSERKVAVGMHISSAVRVILCDNEQMSNGYDCLTHFLVATDYPYASGGHQHEMASLVPSRAARIGSLAPTEHLESGSCENIFAK